MSMLGHYQFAIAGRSHEGTKAFAGKHDARMLLLCQPFCKGPKESLNLSCYARIGPVLNPVSAVKDNPANYEAVGQFSDKGSRKTD